MNRLWNLWCDLSGMDSSDSRQKLAFNMDRRVATLSAHAATLVEGFATYVWSAKPGISQHEFLDLWLAEVTEDQRRRDEVVERQRAEQLAAEARRLHAEQEAVSPEREEAERRRKAEADEQRRTYKAAEERRLAHERARLREERQRSAAVRSQIGRLYNITSVANLARIASRGILCHDLAAGVRHDDVSDRGVQDRRDGRIVDGAPLHRFANLYLNPRNAMLYRLYKFEGRDVVVLEVSVDVLDQPGVIVFDGNAAARVSEWRRASDGLAHLDPARIRSATWHDAAGDVDPELKRVTQAEVLVPDVVAPRFIEGFLAPSAAVLERASRVVGHWPGQIDRWTFFDGGPN